MSAEPMRYEPTLFGELYRTIKNKYLYISDQEIANKLYIKPSTSSAWATYKQSIKPHNCTEIVKIFKLSIKNVSEIKKNELEGFVRYAIDISGLDKSLKDRILKRETLEDLIEDALTTACQNKIPFQRIDINNSELIKKYVNFNNKTNNDLSKTAIVGVPRLPKSYMIRPDYIDSIKQAIFGQNVVGIIGAKLGIYGMGGIGKTVLATAIAHDEEIHRAFPDGIYWVTLGRIVNILNSQRNIFLGSGVPVPDFKDGEGGSICLIKYFNDKNCLLILDDVWDVDHANYFNVLNDKSCLLMTTRIKSVIDKFNAESIQVDLVSMDEAEKIIADSAGQKIEELPPFIEKIINKCGRLFLVLCMVGSIVKNKQDKNKAWQNVLKRLYDNEKDYESFKKDHPDYQYAHLSAAIEVSLDNLKDKVKDLYFDFAIFPEDQPTPEKVIETLWVNRCKDSIKEYQVEEFLDLLASHSLLIKNDQNCYSIHDVLLDYIRIKLCPEGVLERHQILLSAYEKIIGSKLWYMGPNDGYFFEWLSWHLKQAGQEEELIKVLWDPQWYKSKIKYTSVYGLISDFSYIESESLELVKSALALSSHIIDKDLSQLESQLTGRLVGFENKEIKYILENMKMLNTELWLRPLTPSLIPPEGYLIKTLAEHEDNINHVAITPDGKKAVSASNDTTLRVWDLESGKEIFPLIGHRKSVNHVAITPDGKKAVSASFDTTLRVWDLESGKEIFPLIGHKDIVTHVAITRDGKKVVSASFDKTMIVWDLDSGKEIFPLIGHKDIIHDVVITPDGKKAVSASVDTTLRVWDLESGKEIFPLIGHRESVNHVAITPDGKKVVSASFDKTMIVWDLDSGKEIYPLIGHSENVQHVVINSDGKTAISTSCDILRVWDLESSKKISPLIGHIDRVNHVAITPDGKKAVSASFDNTMIVWDLESGKEIFPLIGHKNGVRHVVITSDGKKAVSASFDTTLRVWDLESGKEIFPLIEHIDTINDVVITPDGKKAVSISWDYILRVWDLESGKEIFPLIGHKDKVTHVAITPDGKKAVSASDDTTLRVWDLKSGKEIFPLIGHKDKVRHVAITPNGKKAVSASIDNTLIVWDLESGKEIFPLIGHKNGVRHVVITPNGKKAVSTSFDKTMIVWDLDSGKEISPLIGHKDIINDVVITPDGKKAVSASIDKTMIVWDLESGKTLSKYIGDYGFMCIDISDTQKKVIAGDNIGHIHILKMENF